VKYKYSKFTGDDLDELDLEELLSKLSDLFLGSGFDNPYGFPYEDDDGQPGHSRQSLHDAIMEAILNGGMLSEETLERLLGKDWRDAEDAEQRLDQLIDKIIEKLQAQGYLSGQPDLEAERQRREASGGGMGNTEQYRFEITDKSLDFLGYKALRDLLGSLGKSSLGRHDTREMATGIEASGASKPYEFGDTMNLDASGTILNAVLRTRSRSESRSPLTGTSDTGHQSSGIAVDYEDLMVAQGEYQSSCATVLMLDCSHSMILYGEDRFTPAKRVALALANLIRLQYPGDALKVVLFHD
jgi:Ca-activated chloride channel family protein